MDENSNIPLPVRLNCWKHHAGFIKQQINETKNIIELETLKAILLKTGESQMDLYWGSLSPAEISEQVILFLHKNKIFTYVGYCNWLLKSESDYKILELKDKSIWILRLGEDSEKYVHIHPGRYSPQTRRVKATTLKTAVFILASINAGESDIINTEVINQIRKKYLNEPPVKSYSNTPGLKRLIDLLKEI